MIYDTKLEWVKDFNKYPEEQQKVLLALSHPEYKWRAKERLQAVTGLDREALETALTGLMKEDLVQPSFSKNKNIIFGIKQRVGSK